MIEFRTECLDKNGDISEEKNAVVWLIKDGETLHCTCFSKEAAGYVRQYLVNLNIENQLSKTKRHFEIFEFNEHKFIVETELGLKAVKLVKEYLEVMNICSGTKNHSAPIKTPSQSNPTLPTGKLKG
ncbi:hypothetical protein [Pseudomonas sp. 31 R 17]|uniref:hypothetical protein n=1 Tax=Pseudomonas sp. 31 R 17 TaxID=1844101 RepID=UPI000812658F|nr:hypothetical protein [Pseudomonas sp. 31 R 17]CRM71266.1 hypothetical protein [Pseudomonas sp. 31 R 17]